MTITLPDTDTDQGYGPLLEVMASIRAGLGRIAEQNDKQEAERYQILQAIRPLDIPAGIWPNTSSNTTGTTTCLIASAELFGPRTGVCWDVRRITVTGLGTASTEVVSLYKVATPSSASAVSNNLITTFSGQNPAPYGPGLGACFLRHGESLMVYGTGLSSSDVITVTWSGVEVDTPWVGAYLL